MSRLDHGKRGVGVVYGSRPDVGIGSKGKSSFYH